ncbi:Uncharacterised protein [Neisseria subflava]|nr:Uncharacterised protein [Neisseria subflava]
MGFFRKLFGRKRRGDSAVSVDKTAGINLTGSVLRVPKSAFNVTVTPWGLKAETALGVTWRHQYGLQTTETKNLKLKEWVVDYILADSDRGMRRGSLNGGLSFNVLRDFDQGSICVFNTWSFNDGETEIVERGGTLYKNWDAERSIGEAVGTLSEEGEVSVTDLSIGFINLKINSGIVRKPQVKTFSYAGRTPAAPVKPESFTVYAGNGEIVGRSNASGEIAGGITGKIDYETGFYEIKRDEGFYPEDLRYNAVTQDNLPLDSSIIGIDAVRLPADGRVPVFRKGDMIVISNRLKQDLGSAFTAAQKITLNRQNIDRLCLVDSKGKHVLAEKYTADLKAGSITFAEPLDLSQYTLPLTAVCAWEEENRVTGVDISGRLKLQFAIGRSYPKEHTFVSSALIGGDLLVRATEPFSQQAWDNVWSDAQRGEPVLARANVKDYPIKLASNGAITERWLIKFVTATQFELYGERLGLVAKSDTLTDLAPANPATGKPYFTFKAAAFGGGWSVQNCIRFNTYGTPLPVWILRSVQPSPDKQNGRDGFTACLRGNTVAE